VPDEKEVSQIFTSWNRIGGWLDSTACVGLRSCGSGAPLRGATLLHIATECEEAELVGWLLDKGMNVNIRAEMNSNGFGGQTALSHASCWIAAATQTSERRSGSDFSSRGTRMSTSIAMSRRSVGAGSFMSSRMCLMLAERGGHE
jgi:hypothetical protein